MKILQLQIFLLFVLVPFVHSILEGGNSSSQVDISIPPVLEVTTVTAKSKPTEPTGTGKSKPTEPTGTGKSKPTEPTGTGKSKPTMFTGSSTPSKASTTPKPGWSDDNYNVDDDYRGPSRYGSRYNDRSSGRYRYDDDNDRYGYDDDNNNYGADEYGPPPRNKRMPDEYANMNIYVREPSKHGKQKKYKRVRFPVHRFKPGHFPPLPPLISFLPWLPIFADRLTKQTIIFSPTGGLYIIPPLINFYGQLFSVAQLIASGYASLVSSGIPPPPAVNVAPLVAPGAVAGPGIPPPNVATGGFSGGVTSKFGAFPQGNNGGGYKAPPAKGPYRR